MSTHERERPILKVVCQPASVNGALPNEIMSNAYDENMKCYFISAFTGFCNAFVIYSLPCSSIVPSNLFFFQSFFLFFCPEFGPCMN